jgi:hypothetical protein
MTNATANIADLKNPPAPRETRLAPIQPGFGDLQSFELLQRGARLLASSPLVPDIFRGADGPGVASCVIALNMALRMKADPLMVMQNLYVVHGRPAWSAQFLIACFNQCGRFSAIRYRWQSERGKDDWGCRAFAKELSNGEEIVGPLVTMQTAQAEGWLGRTGSKWKTIPELMLTYRAAAWMVRTHAPELAMGLPTAEEMHDYIDVTPAREPLTPEGIKEAAHTVASQPQPADATDSVPTESNAGKAAPLATAADLLGDGPAYAEIADRINAAKSKDAVDTALSLIHSGLPEKQRTELADLGRAQKLSIGD